MAEGYHVPSVPRGLLLPVLDTYKMRDEELPDPTPPGSHWLFRPPPLISWADLEAETVTIDNPSAWRGARLDGYTLTDRHQRHTYRFPPGSVVRARRSVILYCCPGQLSEQALENLPRNAVLWRNQDGSLRKKEVLDNTGDVMVLSDAAGQEVAALEIPASKDGKQKKQMKKLAGVKRAQVLALRTLVLSLCYLRLAFTGVAAARVTVNPDVFLLFTGLAHFVDLLSRWASSQPGVPMDSFGVVLATMGDRLSALVLLGSLVLLDKDPRHSQIFAGILALDMATSWLLLSVASSGGGSDPLAGGALVRGRGGDAAPDFPTLVMLRHPLALTLVSLGSEAFLLWSYFVAASSLPPGLGPMAAKLGSFISGWFYPDGVLFFLFAAAPAPENSPRSRSQSQSLLMSAAETTVGVDATAAAAAAEMELDGGVFGGFEPSRITPAALGLAEGLAAASDGGALDGAADGGAVMWKAVWMVLAVCCACRQLLSFIQAVISLSSLSSGVISNAAGKDLRRRNPRPRRGRGSSAERFGGGAADGAANYGGAGSASVSRARSRSRLR